ncbi:penicillin-binding transpeptidase domain-containing protein [Kitasatospora sp. NPDC051853]|uniref:penicillin-binding transpeptidase domain-containing protein n=1 Tax=Kitasatospora sp. NPDC051853 TaxID=3364058 RepID=UPI00378D3D81
MGRVAAGVGFAVAGAVVCGAGGYAAYALVGGPTPGGPKATAVVTGPPTAGEAAKGAEAFLKAWADGDYEEAGRLTDRPESAVVALTRFRTELKPTAVSLALGGTAPASSSASPAPSASPSAATEVPLAFRAEVRLPDAAQPWRYDGAFTMVRGRDGRVVVRWSPDVVHPRLTGARDLMVRPITASPSQVVDRKGRPVGEFPSVKAVLGQIRFEGTEDPGSAGRGVVAVQQGSPSAAEQLFTITEPKDAAKRRLTLDADLQRAAEAAVAARTTPASIVAVEPSTGHVLAFANNPARGQNRAFGATLAPGSTMKVVTAAALLEGGLTPDSPLPCPATTTVSGRTVPNDFPDARPGYTLKDDFAQSCNTAFLDAGGTRLKGAAMPGLAREVFGLGLVWQTGIDTFDTSVPVESNPAEAAMALIGQGRIQTNALAMASVSATVQSGTFRQPVLIPGLPQQKAARTLGARPLNDLRAMMRRTAESGTASGALRGIAGAAGKTGTAEVNGQPKPNSWFTGYRGDLAVAAEVQAGGHGSDAAAPAAASLLRIGNGGR